MKKGLLSSLVPDPFAGNDTFVASSSASRQLAPAEEQYLGSTAVFFACYRRDLSPGRPEDDRFWHSNTHSRCKRTERI